MANFRNPVHCICSCLAFFACTDHCHSQSISATLTPQQTSSNSASVTTFSSDITVDSISNEWNIDSVSSQIGYHWKISFNTDDWNMSSAVSNLTLIINSNSAVSSGDRDLLISFSQNERKYFTIFFPLDNAHQNLMYPAFCDISEAPTQPLVSGNLEELMAADTGISRERKSMGGDSGYSYTTILPVNCAASGCYNEAPFIFKIINNAADGWSKYEYTNPSVFPWKQGCGFEAFTAGSPIDIYVSADDNGESLNVKSFQLTHEWDTLSPTGSPTTATRTTAPNPLMTTTSPHTEQSISAEIAGNISLLIIVGAILVCVGAIGCICFLAGICCTFTMKKRRKQIDISTAPSVSAAFQEEIVTIQMSPRAATATNVIPVRNNSNDGRDDSSSGNGSILFNVNIRGQRKATRDHRQSPVTAGNETKSNIIHERSHSESSAGSNRRVKTETTTQTALAQQRHIGNTVEGVADQLDDETVFGASEM